MPQREHIELFDAMHSTRAMRYLKPDPIPDEVLWDILDAAIRGPSGGNAQGWGWVVVRDAEVKRQIAEWYREGWQASYGTRREQILSDPDGAGLGRANYLSAEHLAEHLEEAPVWVIPVLRNAATRPNPRAGSSIYGAVQNLALAARGYGIGATLTSLYAGHEDDTKRLLGIPEDALTMALIPLGYPARGQFSQPKRRPVEEVTHWERWGEQKGRG
ncbi:MAG: nitroreductase [Dehalococcoidia bacterium]|nr:nitroreductase [Dehalococcoidia bacterium]